MQGERIFNIDEKYPASVQRIWAMQTENPKVKVWVQEQSVQYQVIQIDEKRLKITYSKK